MFFTSFVTLVFFPMTALVVHSAQVVTGGDDKYPTYTAGKWNYDYSQILGSEVSGCPDPCATTDKCGPHCWLTIIDTPGKNQCDPKDYPLQTPIDISNYQSENSPVLDSAFENVLKNGLSVTNAGCDTFKILADDHAWEINFKETSCTSMKMTWKGHQMTLEQFHTHTPSEHTINGKYADGELHMVHKAYDGSNNLLQAAVLGVMLVVDSDLKESQLTKFWNLIDAGAAEVSDWSAKEYTAATKYSAEWEVQNADEPVDAYALLPDDKTFYHYIGSLTTYPCTNGINWFLFQEPMYITEDDLANLQSAVKHQDHTLTLDSIYDPSADNRPIQPQGDRRVWKYTDGSSKCDQVMNPFGCAWTDDDVSFGYADDDSKPPPPPGGLIAAAVIAAFFGGCTLVLLFLRIQTAKVAMHQPVAVKEMISA